MNWLVFFVGLVTVAGIACLGCFIRDFFGWKDEN